MAESATVQGIVRRFLDPATLDGHRRRVCGHLSACRTEALGGMRLQCDRCDTEQQWYHGCRDRHCPQCQARATRCWAERQQANLLPVPYYHLVFTLPHALNGWVQLHPEVVYRGLFSAVWGTLKAFGRDPRRLGGDLGMTAVLHTWSQTLTRHVHLHCLVPGGVLCDDGSWRASRGHYLFPVRALSRHVRGRMVGWLRQAAGRGELSRVTRVGEVDAVLEGLMATEWVVYTKPCLAHTASVVDYLARYTHRIAITNARILAVDEKEVTLRYRGSGERPATMTLPGAEFVRRFLLHVLPKGLMRVRHFGFLANRVRREKLERIRRALSVALAGEAIAADHAPDWPCPRCRAGRLHVIARLLSPRLGLATLGGGP